eukprot:g6414.t1
MNNRSLRSAPSAYPRVSTDLPRILRNGSSIFDAEDDLIKARNRGLRRARNETLRLQQARAKETKRKVNLLKRRQRQLEEQRRKNREVEDKILNKSSMFRTRLAARAQLQVDTKVDSNSKNVPPSPTRLALREARKMLEEGLITEDDYKGIKDRTLADWRQSMKEEDETRGGSVPTLQRQSSYAEYERTVEQSLVEMEKREDVNYINSKEKRSIKRNKKLPAVRITRAQVLKAEKEAMLLQKQEVEAEKERKRALRKSRTTRRLLQQRRKREEKKSEGAVDKSKVNGASSPSEKRKNKLKWEKRRKEWLKRQKKEKKRRDELARQLKAEEDQEFQEWLDARNKSKKNRSVTTEISLPKERKEMDFADWRDSKFEEMGFGSIDENEDVDDDEKSNEIFIVAKMNEGGREKKKKDVHMKQKRNEIQMERKSKSEVQTLQGTKEQYNSYFIQRDREFDLEKVQQEQTMKPDLKNRQEEMRKKKEEKMRLEKRAAEEARRVKKMMEMKRKEMEDQLRREKEAEERKKRAEEAELRKKKEAEEKIRRKERLEKLKEAKRRQDERRRKRQEERRNFSAAKEMREDELKLAFDVADVDRDGRIDITQFSTLLSCCVAAFGRVGGDNTPISKKDCEKLFKLANEGSPRDRRSGQLRCSLNFHQFKMIFENLGGNMQAD